MPALIRIVATLFLGILIAVFPSGCMLAPPAADRAEVLAVVGGTLIDGAVAYPRPDTTIIMREGRVSWVGPDSAATIPPRAQVVSAHGRFVIPGMFDAHVHLASVQTPTGVVRQEIQKLLDAFLLSGVTSVLDCWATEEIFDLRRLIEEGSVEGPRLFVTGPGLTAPGAHGSGFGYATLEPTSPEEARGMVRALVLHRPDLIKIAIPSLSREIVRAITDEAHQARLRVGAHVLPGPQAAQAIEDGVDVLLHGFSGRFVPDPEAFRRWRIRGGLIVPTLVVEEPFTRLKDEPEFLTEPALVQVTDPRVLGRFRRRGPRISSDIFAKAAHDYQRVADNVIALHRRGVPIAGGSDAGNLAVFHGPALHREAELLVRAGLTPRQALRAVTRTAARVVGRQHEIGVLAVGWRADLVVLREDPTQDIRALSSVEAVVKDGQLVDLERLRRRVREPLVRRLTQPVFADFSQGEPTAHTGSRFVGIRETGAAPHSTVRIAVESSRLLLTGAVAEERGTFGGAEVHLAPFGLSAIDLDPTPAVRFRARGDGGIFRLELVTLDTERGVFGRAFKPGRDWKTFEIKLDRLRPIGVAGGVPRNLARSLSLRWVTAGVRRGPFRLELDDIQLVRRRR